MLTNYVKSNKLTIPASITIFTFFDESLLSLRFFFCPDDDGVAKCVYTSKDLLSAHSHNIIVIACPCMSLRLSKLRF
jgi:hypothetical protein